MGHWLKTVSQEGVKEYKNILRTFLVIQWQRLQPPAAGAGVQSLVRELDPTCGRAAKPVCYSCWACAQSSCLAATGATTGRSVCTSTMAWHPLAAT